MRITKKLTTLFILVTLLTQASSFAAVPAPVNIKADFLTQYIAEAKKTSPNIGVLKTTLEAGNYSIEYKLIGDIDRVEIIDSQNAIVKYSRPSYINQRDIFPIKTFTNEIMIPESGSYTIITYFKTKNIDVPVLTKFVKRTSAMAASDLHTWSASYTDNSIVKVLNNGNMYVNVAKYAPEIVSFSQVSTKLNRTFTILDTEDIIILRQDFADILIKVNEELMKSGYRLLIYDGYRTKASTGKLYQHTLNDLKKPYTEKEYPEITQDNLFWYVVDPNSNYDRHGKGAAADVSLVDMKTGEIITMPTRINTMNREAWIDRTKAKSSEYQLLWSVMKKHGALPYGREWYHFSILTNNSFMDPTADLRKNFYPKNNPVTAPSAWAADAVKWATKTNVLPATLTKNFKRAITKSEFIEMSIKVLENSFQKSILVSSDYFRDSKLISLLKAKTIGVISGSNGYFYPAQSITREQTATIMSKLFAYLNTEATLEASLIELPSESISEWAKEDVRFAITNGLMSFKSANKFEPKQNLTVEEAISVLYKLKTNQPIVGMSQ